MLGPRDARLCFVLAALCVVVGCGDDDDAPTDLGVGDLGVTDLGTTDLGAMDLGLVDAGPPDLAGCPDADGDGHASAACGGDDCDDADAARYPDNSEVCDAAGHDEDCNDDTFGTLDVDGDGAVSTACCALRAGVLECGPDCNDARADIGYRSAQEICDGIDNDCDGAVDEASVAIPWYRDLDGDGFGDPRVGTTLSCAPPSGFAVVPFDCDDRSSAVSPTAAELCNGRDDDCDGAVDEDACGGLPDGGVQDGGLDAGVGPDLGADPCARCVWRCVAEACDDPIRVATHGFGGCAVRELGGLACWGNSGDGQIGIGPGDSSPRPVAIALSEVVQVTGGYVHVCALTAAGAVYCWGDNFYGQLGVGDMDDRLAPTRVMLDDVIEVSAGGAHTCARVRTGELYCWGANGDGQLGIETLDTALSPRLVHAAVGAGPLRGVVTVRAGGSHTCASTGVELYCWGANGDGQLGVGDDLPRLRPVRALLPRTPVSLATAGNHTCAVDRFGYLYCWGSGAHGELGAGVAANVDAPQRVTRAFPADLVEVVAGAYHTCVRLRDGTVWCVGGDESAQLGDGVASHSRCFDDTDCSLEWVAANVENAVSLAAMELASCAFLVSGEITCWGNNDYGALGAGDFDVHTVPQLVTTP